MIGRRVLKLVALVIALVAAAGLYRFYGPSGSTATPSQGGSASKGGGGPAIPIISVPVQVEDFPIRRRTIGIIESPASVVVKSRIESQVSEQHVKDGQFVKKGDLLFVLDDSEIKATIARDEAQIEKDQATLMRTEEDLQRYQRLIQNSAVARQQLDQAVAENKVAQAVVDIDKAQLQSDNLKLGYTKIVAPIDGRVGAIRVTPGNLISANDATGLVTITQIKPIRVAFTLAERDLTAVRKAESNPTPAVVRAYAPAASEALATGMLDFVDSAVDQSSGTIAAKGFFANESMDLWPGMYVDVEIDLDVRPNTVMIPSVAIQSGQKGPFVFVAKQDQRAEMRMVSVAGIEGDRAALVSGVNEGERVIVEGQMRLVEGARVTEVNPAADKKGEGPSEARR